MALSLVFLLFCLLCPVLVFGNHTHSLAFDTYDLDKSDFIESKEFTILVRDLFDSESEVNSPKNRLMPKQIAKLYEMLDLTGDGLIDRIEFAKIWHHFVQPVLNPKSILLVFNLQNDYLLPDGSMYMKGADSVVPTINSLIEQERFSKVYYIRDYHPENHCSFNYSTSTSSKWTDDFYMVDEDQYYEEATYDCNSSPERKQVLWPKHCIQQTSGANFCSDLVISKHSSMVKFINKGTDVNVDSYSAILDNAGNSLPLLEELDNMDNEGQIVTIFLVGVMLEYEIRSTALDAVYLGHPTVVLSDAVWSKDVREEKSVLESLQKANVIIANSNQVYPMLNGRNRKLEAGFVLANRMYQKYRNRF